MSSILSNILSESKLKSTNTFYELLEVLEKELFTLNRSGGPRRRKLVLLNLPTGYGKTRISILMGRAATEGLVDSFLRVIHVIPTRNLAEDILDHAYALGLKATAQYMFADYSIKTPYFLSPFTVTTLDSYSFNFLKIPVAEVRRVISEGLGHAEIPRYSIYTALNFIDEYHIFMSNELVGNVGEFISKATTLLYFIVRHLVSNSITDVVLSSATPTLSVEFVRDELGLGNDEVLEVTYDLAYGPGVQLRGNRVLVNDKDFNSDRLDKRIKTEIIEECIENIVKSVESALSVNAKVLIVLNTVRRVLRVYEELRNRGIVGDVSAIVHARFRIKDRVKTSNRLKSISKGVRGVVIASPAIEVGVNFDADYLISDLAPLPSLIQRSGRLLRELDGRVRDGVFQILVNRDELMKSESTYMGVYPKDIVKITLDVLQKVLRNGMDIDWKIPYSGSIGSKVSYKRLSYALDLKPKINVRYFSILNCLVSPMVGPKDVNELLRFIGNSFVRYSPITALLIPDEEVDELKVKSVVESYGDEYINYLVPIELRMLVRFKDVLVMRDDRVFMLFEDVGGNLVVDEVPLKDVENILKAGRRGHYFPLALIGTPRRGSVTYYDEFKGLVL